MEETKINVNEQVNMILDIANQLRGPFKEDEYQNVIIPLTICRRFECILEKTKDKVVKAFKTGVKNDKRLKYLSGFSIYNTSEFTLKTLLDEPSKISSNFKDYLEHFNDTAKQIFIQMKFFDTIDALEKGKKLYQVIKRFSNTDLSVEHVSSMQMGYIMEEIIRTYSENASAGDHFTPREVIRCLTKLLLAEGCDDLFEAGKIVTLGDFACGTGGMISEGYRMIKQLNSSTDIELFGQDNNGWYEGIAEAEMIIKGQNPEHMKLVESTLTTDAFPDNSMRLILMNPPFGLSWSKEKIGTEQYDKILNQNKATGWYPAGLPSSSDSQMLFWQYALNKLDDQKGRCAIICNGSPLFGSNQAESNIRKWILDNDWMEAIVQFCPELFYNTSISIYAIIFNKNKSAKRKGLIQVIDATNKCYRLSRGLGYKRNAMTESQIDEIVKIYTDFKEDENSKIFDKYDFFSKEVESFQPYQRIFKISQEGIEKLKNESSFMKLFDESKYNELLENPSKTQAQVDLMTTLKKGEDTQKHIIKVLLSNISSTEYIDRDIFAKIVNNLLPELNKNKSLIKAIISSMSIFSEKGKTYKDKKGNLESDPDLKDIEIIPYKESVDSFFEREVYPFAPKSWFIKKPDEDLKIWCDIKFSTIFGKYKELESSDEIARKIKIMESKELSFDEVIKDE